MPDLSDEPFGSLDPLGLFSRGEATPQRSRSGGRIPETYYDATRASESGGDPAAKNKRSTATGLYQFTEGTWRDLAGKNPDLALTPDGRTDPRQQERAVRRFTEQNAAALERAGVPVDGGTLYAAHFLGAKGALGPLTAAYATPMQDLVSPKVIEANPFLTGMTAGSFRKWAARKGGAAAGPERPATAPAEPPADLASAPFGSLDPMGLFRPAPAERQRPSRPAGTSAAPAEPGWEDLARQVSEAEGDEWEYVDDVEGWRAAQMDGSGELIKAFKSAIVDQNPTLTANVLDMVGALTGLEAPRDWARSVREIGEAGAWTREARVGSIADVGSAGDAVDYVGAMLGQGLGSVATSIAGGVVGAAGGALAGAVGGPVGAAGGAVAGAVSASLVQNAGDVHGAVMDSRAIAARIEAGEITERQAAAVSLAAGGAMAALDAFGLAKMIGFATEPIKAELKRRVVQGLVQGATVEAITESLQEVISQTAQASLGDDTAMSERLVSVVDNAIAGALTGGVVGGVAHGARRPGAGDGDIAGLEADADGPSGDSPEPAAASPARPTGPLSGALEHAERTFAASPAATTATARVNDPGGELDGTTLTVDPDQSDAPAGMVRVTLPDGRPHVIGEALLEPAAAGATMPGATVPDGAPDIGASVRIEAEGVDPIHGMVEGYEDGEAIVVDTSTGEIYQVPLETLTKVAPSPAEFLARREAERAARDGPEPEAAAPAPQPDSRGTAADTGAIQQPDEVPEPPPSEPVAGETTTTLPPREEQQPAAERLVGPPQPGQRVIVDSEAGGRFPARVESYEGDGAEAVVVGDDGVARQVDVGDLYVTSKTPAQAAQEDRALNPPVAPSEPPSGPEHRRVGRANIRFPDEAHARLYDLGRMRQESIRLSGKGQLARDRVNPSAQAALAREFGVDAHALGQMADDYRYRAERTARSALSERPLSMQSVNATLRRRLAAESARRAEQQDEGRPVEAPPAPETPAAAQIRPPEEQQDQQQAGSPPMAGVETDWWGALTPDDRRALLAAAGVKRSEKTAWDKFPANIRRKIEATGQAAPTPTDQAAHEAATSPTNGRPEPTEPQKEAGNYPLGHVRLGGLDISVENPAGSERSGTDRSGKRWSVTMRSHYGYIRGTRGRDKDHIDVFVRPGTEALADDAPVFVVDQVDPGSGRFDEHKLLVGFPDEAAARAGYLANYDRGWKGLRAITGTTLADFRRWLAEGDTTKAFAPAVPESSGTVPELPLAPPAAAQDPAPFAPKTPASREEPKPQDEPAGATFRTAKGSTYRVHADGTTTRDKAYRPEHGVAEQGVQPRSERTFYVTREDAERLGEIQAQGGPKVAIADVGDGRVGMKYLGGKDTGKFERRTVVTPRPEPEPGLIPVELWNRGTRVHFGNAITAVTRAAGVAERSGTAPELPSQQPAEPVAPAPPQPNPTKPTKRQPKPKPAPQLDRLENYFRPGRLVPAYAGTTDRILSFERRPDLGRDRWAVRVEEVGADGRPAGGVRVHETPPDERLLRAWERENPVPPKPKAKPAGRAAKARAALQSAEATTAAPSPKAKIVRHILGADVGDTVTASAAIDAQTGEQVSEAGHPYHIRSIGRNGDVHVTDEAAGAEVVWRRGDILRARNAGVTFAKGRRKHSVAREAADGSRFAAAFLAELARHDALFQNPVSRAQSLAGVFADIMPEVKILGQVDPSDGDRANRVERKTMLRTGRGKDFYVFEDDDTLVWIDVSRLDPGERGSSIYAAVANYAHNAGKVFAGDPAGLSDMALRRRTEAMLSSAIKLGTTAHLAPHPSQTRGNERLGVPPLRWTVADHEANVASLIETSITSVRNLVPEIDRARYDFDSRTFRRSTGEPLSAEDLRGWASRFGRVRAAGAGSSTLQRSILLNTLARAQGRERPRLLEQALRFSRELVERGGLRETFYSVGDGPVATLTGDELGLRFRRPQDMRGLRRAAQAWYREHLIGHSARMADGTMVRFSGRGMRKTTGPAQTDYLLRAVPAIRAIIETGRIVHREPGNRPRIVERAVIAAPIEIAGVSRMLAVSVHKTANGDYHYDLTYGWEDAGRPGVGVPGEEAKPRKDSRQSASQSAPGDINLFFWADTGKAVSRSAAAIHARLRAGPTGAFVDRLIVGRRVRIGTAAALGAPAGVQAWTDPDGTIALVADRIAGDPTAVLLHEAFHVVEPLIGSKAWGTLMQRLSGLYRQFERPGTGARRHFDAARERVARARAAAGPMTEALTVEEFGAYAVEEYASVPRSLRTWVDDLVGAVKAWVLRRFGRQLGAVTPAELRALALSALRDTAGSRPAGSAAPRRYSVGPATLGADRAKLDRAEIVDAIAGRFTDWKPRLMALIPLNYLSDLKRPGMVAVDQYLKIKRAMDAYRGEKHAAMDAIAQDWLKFASSNRKAAAALADLMHATTLAGVDPTTIAAKDTDAPREAAILKRWRALPSKARDLYEAVRDAYARQQAELDAIILENVRKAQEIADRKAEERFHGAIKDLERKPGMSKLEREAAIERARAQREADRIRSGWARKARMTRLRRQFESSRVPAPYFPLGRFGQYFVTVRDAVGDTVSFSRFEREAERRRWLRDNRGRIEHDFPGATIEAGVLDNTAGLREAMDPRVIADIEGILGNAGVDDAVLDAIWQRYLTTMPDLSIRKRYIHRKGTAGWHADALRTFGSHMFHAAHQMGRMKFGLDLQELVGQVKDQARRSDDPTRGMLVANELALRHEWVKNPKGSKVAQWVTSAAFVWYLGATPAAAIVNATQTIQFGIPILGARFGGMGRAAAAITRASADAVAGKGSILEGRLTDKERRAVEAAYDTGLIDRTQSHDLAGVGDTGVQYSPLRAKWMGKASWMFHRVEVFNRETTYLAAYRLARESGSNDEQAVDAAHKLTWMIHFDYSNTNRPRFMQNDFAKVAMVFMNYQVNAWYRIFRDLHQSLAGETAQSRREARYQLAGVLAMTGLMAGLMGMPLYALLTAIAGAVLDDDDDPRSFAREMEGHVREILGADLGELVLKGVPGYIGGIDLTSRIGLQDFFLRAPLNQDAEGRQLVMGYMASMFGATGSALMNMGDGAVLMSRGSYVRGVEVAAPKFVKDGLKAWRYIFSGLTNPRGEEILPADALEWRDIIVQAIGFTPARVAEAYERRGTLFEADRRISDERSQLLNRFAGAVQGRDSGARAAALDQIRQFNRKPYGRTNPITPDTLERTLQTRRRNAARREEGVIISNERLNRYLRALLPDRVH